MKFIVRVIGLKCATCDDSQGGRAHIQRSEALYKCSWHSSEEAGAILRYQSKSAMRWSKLKHCFIATMIK